MHSKASEQGRIGDFTALRLQGTAVVSSEVRPPLLVGDLVFLTAPVTFTTEQDSPQVRRRLRSQRTESAWLTLWAEGTADPAVKLLNLPIDSFSPHTHQCLFEVKSCWFPAQTDKKAEKEHSRKTASHSILNNEELQLKHVLSGSYLAFSELPGTQGFRVTLEPRTHHGSWLRLQRGLQTVTSGRPVLYGDPLLVSGRSGSVDCFLSVLGRLPQSSAQPVFELCGSTQETYFQLQRFRPQTSDSARIQLGEIVQFQHKELGYFLASSGLSSEAHSVVVKNPLETLSYWRIEHVQSRLGGEVLSGSDYFLRNVVTGGYMKADFESSLDSSEAAPFALVSTRKGDTLVEGSDVQLENDKHQRVKIKTDDLQGQDVFRMVPPSRSKEQDKVVDLVLSRDFTEDSLFTFEIRKVDKKAEFVAKVAEILPGLRSFYSFLSEFVPGKEAEMVEYWQTAIRGIDFMGRTVMGTSSKEQMATFQRFLLDCNLPLLLLDISRMLIFKLDTEAGSSLVRKAVRKTAMQSGRALEQALASAALEVIPACLSLLNHMAYMNLDCSAHLARLDREICQLFPYSKKLTAVLLKEIYSLTAPPIEDYTAFYDQWFDRLMPLVRENVEEQTAFVKLLRHVSESAEEVDVLAQAQLLRLFEDPDKRFQLLELREAQGEVWVKFHLKPGAKGDILVGNPDLQTIRHQGEYFALREFGSSKALLKYAEYIAEVLFLLNTVCHENEHALWEVERAVGLTPQLVLSLCIDKQLNLLLRSGFIVLSLNIILVHEATDMKRRVQVDTLVVASELGQEVECPTEAIENLVTWCRELWTGDYILEGSAKENLIFLKAVLRLTDSILTRGYGGVEFVSAVCPALETLLMGLVSPGSRFLPAQHWTQTLMERVKEERKTFLLSSNHLLKQVIEGSVAQLKRIYIYFNTRKVHRLLQHFTQAASEPLRDIILAHLAEDRTKMKEFLGTVAFSQLDLDSDTRNALMALLVTLLARPKQLAEGLRNTQLVQDTSLLQVRARFSILAPLLSVAKSDSKLAQLLGTLESPGLQTITDALTKLLALLSPRVGRQDLLQSTQDMARHFDLHRLLVRLWTAVDARLEREPRAELMAILRLSVDCLYYFVLGSDRNRMEVLAMSSSFFFDVRTRNSAYLVQELSDFEHVSQSSATLCYEAILRKCAEDPALLNGLCWIRASIRRRNSRNCKSDLQVLAALAIREYLRSTSLLHPEHPNLFAQVILLLSESAEDNPLIQTQNQTLISIEDLLQVLNSCENPRLFAAWIRFLAESHFSMSRSQGLEVLNLVEQWLDKAAGAVPGLLSVAYSGWYGQAFPLRNPELVDVHGDMTSTNESAAIWEMLSTGDFWKVEFGLCHSLPHLLPLVSADPAAIKETASKLRKLLGKIEQVGAKNQETVDLFYLQRAVGACYEALLLWLRGKRGTVLKESFVAAALKTPETLDRLFAEEAEEPKVQPSLQRTELERSIEGLYAFSLEVVRVCAEQSPAASYSIKNILFTVPVFAELRQPSVPFRARAQATIAMKMTMRKLEAEYRSALFETLANLLDDCRDKLMVKDVFTTSGVAAAAVNALMARKDLGAMRAALRLLSKLLNVLGVDFQDWLLAHLQTSEAYISIFQLLAAELTCSLDRITYRKTHSGTASSFVPSERSLLPSFFTSGLSVASLVDLNSEVTLALVQLVMNCCDGCHRDFQLFMTQQNRAAPTECGSVDIVGLLAHYVVNLGEDAPSLLNDGQAREMLGACCDALVELVTGPCEENQVRLGADVQLLSALVRLMKLATAHRNERDWYELLQGFLALIHALLEGTPPPDQVSVMGQYLNIPLLTTAMESIYSEHIQGRERAVLLGQLTKTQEANVAIGFSIAMLVMKLRGVLPQHADLIDYDEESWSEGLVFSRFDLPVFRHIPKNCFGFYGSLIGYVEVSRNGIVEANYFRIPAECKFLTPRSKEELISKAMSTSQLQKLFSLLQLSDLYHVEMLHQQQLYARPFFKLLSQSWQVLGLASFCLIIILNLLLLVAGTFDTVTYMDAEERERPFSRAMAILGSMQLAVSALSLLGFASEYYPNILMRNASRETEDMEFMDYPELWHNESVLLSATLETTARSRQWPRWLILVLDPELGYHLILLVVSLAAIFVPFLYSLLLFDIFKRSRDLVVLVRSVTNVWRQLLITVLLTVLVTFMFAVILLMFFTKYIEGSDPQLSCDSLWDCFVASCLIGVRVDGGGLGIALANPQVTQSLYFPRVLLDLIYFAIVVLVIRNIIGGVIVDAFGDMRVQKQQLDEELNQKCFICGCRRQLTESRGQGWSHHFLNEHSIFSYLAFVIYVSALKETNCTGLEMYVKDCLRRNTCVFFPQTSRQLQQLESST